MTAETPSAPGWYVPSITLKDYDTDVCSFRQ